MSKVLSLLCCIALLFALCVGVSATAANDISIFNTVSSDGSCQVTMTVNLHIDQPEQNLTFPVPRDATNITLNGSRVGTQQTGEARLIDLSKILGGMAGDFSFTVNYSLSNLVQYVSEDNLQLSLPLLSGFEYPVEQLQFSVTMPGTLSVKPGFYSGYHQKNIEKDLTYSVSGANIAGRSWNELKDHETLVMTLPVTEEMFPQSHIELPTLDDVGVAVNICAVLALLYWIFFLRNFPGRLGSQPVAPEGFSAGQMISVLSLQGADLGLMIFSWAQLGYVIIRMDRRGHVYLFKSMDMGNERSLFEQKCFRNLFGRSERVDTTSMHYIRQTQATAKMRSAIGPLQHRRSGNIKLFRAIASLCGMFSAASLAVVFSSSMAIPWLLIIPMGLLGLFSAVHMLHWAEGLFLHHRFRLWFAVALSVVWLAVGYFAGQIGVSIWFLVLMVIAGLLAFLGGRRTEAGKQALTQTLSLRRYLRKITGEHAIALYRANPDFFFDLAPHAIALGCSNTFAKKLGKTRMPACPYIQAVDAEGMTALQWSQLMRQILDGMNARQRQLPFENFVKVIKSARGSQGSRRPRPRRR